MEHFFLHFLVRAIESIIKAVDGLFEKSLKQAIPELDSVREDPHKALDYNGIVIGPRRKYFSSTLIGLVTASAGIGLCLLISSMIELPGRRKFGHAFWFVTSAPIGLCCFIWGFRFLRGGYCILTREGVEFRYRKKVVRCSWPVFHAWGQWAIIEESETLLLPISPHALNSIMEMNKQEDAARCTGLEVHTPQWETHSPVEAGLKSLYVVKIQDLGDLLLHLGRKLGAAQVSAQSLGSSVDGTRSKNIFSVLGPKLVPVAFEEDNGWLRMSLTSFHLPLNCCICSLPTRNSFLFQIRNQGESNYYPLHLPTCDSCRAKLKRQKRMRNLVVFFLLPALLLPVIFVFFDRNRPVVGGILLSLPLITFVGIWAIMERVQRLPAQVRYSSKKGTLRLRFRNSDFQKMVLAQRVRK